MAALRGFDLLLFVAGEPDTGPPSLRDSTIPSSVRLIGSIVPLGLVMKAAKPTSTDSEQGRFERSEHPAWHLPPAQIHCVNTVFEIAEEEKRELTVVDVDRPKGRQDLVARWVGPDNVLPLLVRPDGARVEGVENFAPERVRRFIRGR